MKVQDLMTRAPRTCHTTDLANEAAYAMWEGDCGCVPVLDEQERVVGMVTDRDLCMAAYTQGRPLHEIPVHTAMSRTLVRCAAGDELAAAERAMQTHKVRRLPVIDGDQRLLGILSLNDLARAAHKERGHKVRQVGMDGIGTTLAVVCEPRTLAVVPAPTPPTTTRAAATANPAAV